jgi:nitrite reductase (NO-forming)
MPAGWLAFWRIGFGVIWLVDAWFKWQPAFVRGFVSYLAGNIGSGQPAWVNSWIHFWIDMVRVDPHLFAYLVAAGETVIALSLLLGLGVRLTAVAGSVLSLIIWSTGEAFGGPYTTGATDVGAAIIYVGGFALLALTQSGYAFGLDGRYRLSGWSWRKAESDTQVAAQPPAQA